MSEKVDLLTQMQKFKEDYYSQNSKNVIFKKNQKLDCARQLNESFDIDQLLSRTVYIIDKNHVYFDYLVFKLYANEDNYERIVDYVLNIYNYCIENYGDYVIHMNIDTFTVSAAERYKNIIMLFNERCTKGPYDYTAVLKYNKIYFTPNVIDMILKIIKSLLTPEALSKVVYLSKNESKEKLENLLLRKILD
jgi:hypothetical protein